MGEKELSVREMARISGLPENYIRQCCQEGAPIHIQRSAYTEQEVLSGGAVVDEERIEDPAKAREAIRRAKEEGLSHRALRKKKSAEEQFRDYLKSPAGISRLTNPRAVADMKLAQRVGLDAFEDRKAEEAETAAKKGR